MPPTPSLPLIKLPPNTSIFRLGSPSSAPRSSALLRFGDEGLTIPREGRRGWAIVGDGEGRRLAVETLLSRHRILPAPPSPGPFPYITSLASTHSRPVRHLAFAKPPPSGEFTDFTARYGALQEEDKLSFRDTLSALHPTPSPEDIEAVANQMRIGHLLDLPGVSLSSGQTRRGRIAAALLTKPVLLLLEEPMAGLDVESRAEVSRLLGDLNASGEIRIVLVLRGKGRETLPDWVTDVVEVKGGDVWVGKKEEWRGEQDRVVRRDEGEAGAKVEELEEGEGKAEAVVQLNEVSVSYGEGTRKVLDEISWTIRPGDRWHLQGANGSGKTTLLSIILGHHPRSFSLPASSLQLFSKPRRETPTTALRTLIGHTSPEIYASFPRGMGLSAMDTIGSGYEGVFSRRNLTSPQKERVMNLLNYFRPFLTTGRNVQRSSGAEVTVDDLAKRQFSHYTPQQQALLLFCRALVAKAPLVILDEPSQGVDEAIWARCCELLEQEKRENPKQAVVVVTHYADEVPWSRGKVFKLAGGKGMVERSS